MTSQICTNLEQNRGILGSNLEKSFNKRLGTVGFRQKGGARKIYHKTAAYTLLLMIAFAAVIGGLMVTAQATDTNSATSDTSTVYTTTVGNNATALSLGDMRGMMMGDQGFGGGYGHGGAGFAGTIEVSAEYTQTVNNILGNDTDVQNLIAQGYNVTSINPIVKSVIGADGTLTSKATNATVTLVNGTSSYATVKINIEQAKVTQIVILTRTVIDKSTS